MEKLSVAAVFAFQDQSPWFQDSLMMVIRWRKIGPLNSFKEWRWLGSALK